jgi:hypothetical protein
MNDAPENPYKSPADDSPANRTAQTLLFPRMLLYLQMLVTVYAAIVGVSERSIHVDWVRALIGVASPCLFLLVAAPVLIFTSCVKRRLPAQTIALAVIASCLLTVVGLWCMLPLVQ